MEKVVPFRHPGRPGPRPASPGREERARRAEALGLMLRELRLQRGMTQRELALRAGFQGPALVSIVESGAGRLPRGRISAWASALGVEPSRLALAYLEAFEPEALGLLRAGLPGPAGGC